MNRRSFLKRGGSVAVAAGTPLEFIRLAAASPLNEIGLQLITVMSSLNTDFNGTLRSIASIGYRKVETLGSCGRDPASVRSVFNQCDLTSPSQHLVPKDLYKVYELWDKKLLPMEQVMAQFTPAYALERMPAIVEEGIVRAKILGQRYLIWAILFDSQLASSQGITEVIRAFNTAGALCAKEGMKFAYHNGSKSFTRIGNDSAYDLILEHTDPVHVKMELDSYYAARSGANAVEYLEKHPGRFKLMHLKDVDSRGEVVDLGDGTIDFAVLVKAAVESGVEHFFVEHDQPAKPLQSAQSGYEYLKQLTARL
jgi:sugar phosphate isomerase/epimerase